jgi:hypothetical protein
MGYFTTLRKICLIFFIFPGIYSCRNEKPLFQQIKASHSGITFNNQIQENDTMNALDLVNLYNGSGIGIGDFNNDGLPDIFFAGSLVPCKLYLNQGRFKFRDITEESKAEGKGRWCSGVSVIDINNDGWMDIYVCATMNNKASDRKNILYVNQGLSADNVPVFKDLAAEYGLNDSSYSVQSVFFDYDNDGDLDAYIGVNQITESVYRYMNHPPAKNGLNPSTGKLFRNDWDPALKHPVFTDVSRESGIQTEGYANAIYVTDINRDGWQDIFVSNDFLLPDLLWINNQNGTFKDQLGVYFKHITANAMGCDMGDINNDGLMDMVELDMNPEDNFRKKMMLQSNKELQFRNEEGYTYQFSRNTLQLNQGPRVGENDTIGPPVFSDIGYMAGIEATDWSWGPLIADFDNDGKNDILIHNGFPKDVTDRDFAAFRERYYMVIPKKQMLTLIPEVKLHNYAFRNLGDLRFSNVSTEWGLGNMTFTNGSAYADLDLDGDLDLIMNNINDKASIYRNNQQQINKQGNHYLQIKLKGESANRAGLGAWIEIYNQKGRQVWENTPYKGYLSTVDDVASFGLGSGTKVDSVIVLWPNSKKSILRNIPGDQRIIVDITAAGSQQAIKKKTQAENALFREVTRTMNINYTPSETEFNDYLKQPLMPHKFSDIGPALASGDIDGDGIDDFICGGGAYQSARIFLQKEGKFIQKQLLGNEALKTKEWKDAGILLFDPDSDGDLDLYIASGGYEYKSNSTDYRDHFYINTGKGNFTEASEAIPENYASKLNLRAVDIDNDGDLDLFIGGRIDPWKYPMPVSGYIYRNDTRNGKISFTDVTQTVAPELIGIGLINDAIFTDFNEDGWMDIIIAGEWMPLTFFQNQKGTSFRNITGTTGIADKVGWWNSLSAGDFDNDGDIDYLAGNLGLNSYYRASDKYPVSVYAADFNNSGRYYAFMSLFLPVSHTDPTLKEFPAQSREDVVGQMVDLSRKFPDNKTFARATMSDIFTQDQMKGFLIRRANYFSSCFCRNDGNGKFTLHPLPVQAQISVINSMVVDDFDSDGNLDVLLSGNNYGTEVSVGRNDAFNGLVLNGDGKGKFISKTILESGIFIPGNNRALIKLRSEKDRYLVVASQFRGPLNIFELKNNIKTIEWQPDDRYVEIRYKNGVLQKQEYYCGSSYLSQSSGFLTVGNDVAEVAITNRKNQTRVINIEKP